MVTAATAEGPRRHGIKRRSCRPASMQAQTMLCSCSAHSAGPSNTLPGFTNNLQFSYQNSRTVDKEMLITEGDELLPHHSVWNHRCCNMLCFGCSSRRSSVSVETLVLAGTDVITILRLWLHASLQQEPSCPPVVNKELSFFSRGSKMGNFSLHAFCLK